MTAKIHKPKILLIDPGIQIKKFNNNKFVNRGLLSVASLLKHNNHNIDYFSFDQYRNSNLNTILNKLKEKIKKENYNIIALSGLFIAEQKTYLHILKNIKISFPNIITIIGGYYPTFYHKELSLYNFIDFIIQGEGEWAILDLIKNLAQQHNHSQQNHTPTQGDLKQLPPLDYSILKPNYLNSKKPPNINLEFNRGCYFDCSFCSVSKFWRKTIKFHNTSKIITELKQLAKLGYKGKISIEDSTLDLKSKRFKAFFNKVKNINHQYNFDYVVTRYDFIDQESLKLLKNLGFKNIIIGLESASPSILKSINKKIDLNKFKKACYQIKKSHLNLNFFLILGLPGETKQTFKATYKYVQNLVSQKLVSNLFVSYFQPYKNTRAVVDLKKYNGQIISTNPSEWLYRCKPLVEYPHLKQSQLQKMFNSLTGLNKKSKSDFIKNF